MLIRYTVYRGCLVQPPNAKSVADIVYPMLLAHISHKYVLVEEISAHMCDIIFSCRGSVEIVQERKATIYVTILEAYYFVVLGTT